MMGQEIHVVLMIPSTQASLQRNRNNWMIWSSSKEKGLPEGKDVLRHTVYRTCLLIYYVSYHVWHVDILVYLPAFEVLSSSPSPDCRSSIPCLNVIVIITITAISIMLFVLIIIQIIMITILSFAIWLVFVHVCYQNDPRSCSPCFMIGC